MDLNNLPLLAAITRKMSWLADRQKLLAQNVANSDTPRYKSVDLKPLDFRSELEGASAGGRLELVSTDPHHLGTAGASGGVSADALDQNNDEREINGNTVSIEDELLKVSKTAGDYQLMTNLYKKQIGMLKEAIGHGAGS